MDGGPLNVNPASIALPPEELILTLPVEPDPILALMVEEDIIVNDCTAVPPIVTPVVPLKLVPVMVMVSPAAALVGEKELMVGDVGLK
jgi:hypothetical protein